MYALFSVYVKTSGRVPDGLAKKKLNSNSMATANDTD